MIDELPTLVWIANLAALELHTHQATVDDPEHPTAVVFDLDPGRPASILDCCRVALELRDAARRPRPVGAGEDVGIEGPPSRPCRSAVRPPTTTKDFARACGQLLAKQDPDRVTIVMNRDQRAGKVFVDWSQNDRHKTTVTAYSLRARARPTVSTPVSWDEVSDALDHERRGAARSRRGDGARRASTTLGDLYAPGPAATQTLPSFT